MKRISPWVILFLPALSLGVSQAQTLSFDQSNYHADAHRALNGKAEFRFALFPPGAGARPTLRPIGFSLMPAGGGSPSNALSLSPMAAGPNLLVMGGGTLGRLTKWTGFTSSNSFIGDSTIFESKTGLVGIGTDTPTSKLTVAGTIQSLGGGFQFPDGTVQTTSAAGSLFTVSHDSTLTGDGTAASPLGVAVPLTLTGALQGPLIRASNNGFDGTGVQGEGDTFGVLGLGRVGVEGRGGSSGLNGTGGSTVSGTAGSGVRANGGGSFGTSAGGTGVHAHGGNSDGGNGGEGVIAMGGNSNILFGGQGLIANGGNSNTGIGGAGVNAFGGMSQSATGGVGASASGGSSFTGDAGTGLFGRGGNSFTSGDGGDGVNAFAGFGSGAGNRGGIGIVARRGMGLDGATAGLAGEFEGDVEIGGNLNVTGTKNFKIDHPLDPENKYLIHSAIESSEVLNVYSGNVVTDQNGEAVVALPDWFEAINRDLRYQLTVVGTFAQAIVAKKIKNNRFVIQTNAPNVEVSWLVTGVRSDAAMKRHPFKLEEEKPERERGTYLNPEAYGQPEERGVEWARHPQLMRQVKPHRTETGPRHNPNNR